MLVREATLTLKDKTTVLLRSPAGGDARAALAFIRRLTGESWRNLNHPPAFFDQVDEPAEAALLEAFARHPTNLMLSAWDAGDIVGNFAVRASTATLNAHCGEIGMGVLRARHRQGLGEGLMRHGIEAAERAGVWNLHLRVRVYNEPAIRLYEKLGFVRVGVMREAAEIDSGFVDEYVYQRLGKHARLPAGRSGTA